MSRLAQLLLFGKAGAKFTKMNVSPRCGPNKNPPKVVARIGDVIIIIKNVEVGNDSCQQQKDASLR